MGIINSNVAYTGLVEKYIGSAYDIVKSVADRMDSLDSFLDMDLDALEIIASNIETWYIEAGNSASAAAGSASAAQGILAEILLLDIPAKLISIADSVREAIDAKNAAVTAQGHAQNSQAYAKEWATSDRAISVEAGGVSGSRSALHHAEVAETEAIAANNSADYAKEWATKPENLTVSHDAGAVGDEFSSFHHAIKSFDSALNANNSKEIAKAILDDMKSKYIGAFDQLPLTLSDGSPLVNGVLCFHLAANPPAMRVWSTAIPVGWRAIYDIVALNDYLTINGHGGFWDGTGFGPNPHNVTKDDLVLGNVENVSPKEFPIIPGGNLANEFGDIRAAQVKLSEHELIITGNPHAVVREDLSLGTLPSGDFDDWNIGQTVKNYADAGDADRVATNTANNPHGFAQLDDEGRIDPAQIPIGVGANLRYKGLWNGVGAFGDDPAAINNPTKIPPLPTAGTNGNFWIASEAFDLSLPDARTVTTLLSPVYHFNKGDWLISDGAYWQHVFQSITVISVLDVLTSDSSTDALSARQGKLLATQVKTLEPVGGTPPGAVLSHVSNVPTWVFREEPLGKPTALGQVLTSDMSTPPVRSWKSLKTELPIHPTPPVNSVTGTVWFDSETGLTFVNFGNAAKNVWVTNSGEYPATSRPVTLADGTIQQNRIVLPDPTHMAVGDIAQGWVLKGINPAIWARVHVEDNLVSVSKIMGLAANQGRILNEDKQSITGLGGKGKVNGYAGLDNSGKLELSVFPDTIKDAIELEGVWDAGTNTPNVKNTTIYNLADQSNIGRALICSVENETREIGDYIGFFVGDIIVMSPKKGTTLLQWTRISASGMVHSVNTRIGEIVLTKTDVGLGKVDNTSDNDKVVLNTNPIHKAFAKKLSLTGGSLTGGVDTSETVFDNKDLISKAGVNTLIANAAYTHPSHTQGDINTNAVEVISRVTWNSLGHITGVAKRVFNVSALALKSTVRALATRVTTAESAISSLKTSLGGVSAKAQDNFLRSHGNLSEISSLKSKTQNLVSNGDRFTKIMKGVYPVGQTDLATKGYVDDHGKETHTEFTSVLLNGWQGNVRFIKSSTHLVSIEVSVYRSDYAGIKTNICAIDNKYLPMHRLSLAVYDQASSELSIIGIKSSGANYIYLVPNPSFSPKANTRFVGTIMYFPKYS